MWYKFFLKLFISYRTCLSKSLTLILSIIQFVLKTLSYIEEDFLTISENSKRSKTVKKSRAMNSTSLLLIFLAFICVTQSQDDKICVDNYECCKFTQIEGVVSCAQKCEPETACKATAEVAEEPIQAIVAAASFGANLRTVCREGYQLDAKSDA